MQPRLLHITDIDISRIDKSTTAYDEDAREVIQQATRYTTIALPGQIAQGQSKGLDLVIGGVQLRADGYVLFRKYDLDAAGFTIVVGDRFSKFGHLDMDVYVIKLKWIGHYADKDGATLLKAFFQDRQPTKQVGEF